ncbi:IS3 family transposase [uncultured Mucilaginibacter sp.]|uniref:IS3 family transposase n=1 Tax=uncultured Mucilaginibacter sp. TaxID=797541 RepID=UPI0025EB8507|nr:IS3 family transposase [uncultured Mucilaginibacter sp.]
MVYEFILSHEPHYPALTMCHTLSVSRSCYYAYKSKATYVKKAEDLALEKQVAATFSAHYSRYGVRRLVPELRGQGLKMGSYKVRRILREHGLKAIQPRSFVPHTTDSRHPYPISPNLLKEPGCIQVERINQVWAGDITFIPLQNKWSFLAVWMDLYSRKVVGWALAEHMREELVMMALNRALASRYINEGLIVHSDRGGQYAGKQFRKLLASRKIRQSITGKDNPYDNAFMESYFSRFKTEMLQGSVFEKLEDARTEVFEFIEMYYNPIRRHSSLGYISPMAFEQQMAFQPKKEDG